MCTHTQSLKATEKGTQDKKDFEKMVIKGTLISVGVREESDFKSHLLVECTFGQDITFCCLEVYISFLELIYRLKIQQLLIS